MSQILCSVDGLCSNYSKVRMVCVGHEKGADVGPLITKDAKNRVCELVQSGVEEGAKLLLDGRNVKVPGYEKGNFVGMSIRSYSHLVCL